MKLKSKIWMIIFVFSALCLFQTVSYAGEQSLNSLQYDVTLKEDGSAEVVETWDIYVSQTNTLVKTFHLDDRKYSGIRDVKVKDLKTGLEFLKIDESMYHVTKNCFYGLEVENNKFEIAWGVGLDHSSANQKYRISYTIEDVITVYQDCSEFYWQFIGRENTVPAKYVTGTIKLPKSVENIESLRVWAHGPLNGEIQRLNNQTVWFQIDNFEAKAMLEVRIVVEEKIFPLATRKKSVHKLSEILQEEQKWADEANRERNKAKIVIWTSYGVFGGIVVFFLFKMIKYAKKFKQAKNSKYSCDIGKYFRQIPRENESTPIEAAFLYYSNGNRFYGQMKISKVFSATLLQLCLKRQISFEVENEKKLQIHILESKEKAPNLKPSEKLIIRFLKEVAASENFVSMETIKDYAKTHYERFNDYMSDLQDKGEMAHTQLKNYDSEMVVEVEKYRTKSILYVLGLIFGGFFLIQLGLPKVVIFVLAVEFMSCSVLLGKTANQLNVLTQQGEMERQQWKGLKQYMEDFSLLKEKEIPDLVLWEKYLVYATTFGISDKVVEQLKVIYPQINQIKDERITYMHFISDSRFGSDFIQNLNTGVESVYRNYQNAYNTDYSSRTSRTSSSSGSGSGGGFSSGGGGRRRWPDGMGRKIILKRKKKR